MKKENTMSKNLKTEAVDHLFDAILCLKDRAECYTFFEEKSSNVPRTGSTVLERNFFIFRPIG